MDTFWGGLGDQLTSPRAAALVGPAAGFWVGGLTAWLWRHGTDDLERFYVDRLQPLSPVLQGAAIIGVTLAVVASALVVGAFELPVLRLLEGYWPRWGWLRRLRRALVRRQDVGLDRAEARWQILAVTPPDQRCPEDQEEFVALDQTLRQTPTDPRLRMPTALGNVLRAAESRPRDKYGLDAIVLWPRLWLLLPQSVQESLSRARGQLDLGARLFIWGALFVVWTVLAPWAVLVGLVVMILAYRWLVAVAGDYGDLLESSFDLHRFALYRAAGWPPPPESASESAHGERLTEYLFRGTAHPPIEFIHRDE